MAGGTISLLDNQRTLIALMVVASILCFIRSVIRWRKVHTVQIEDFLVWLALAMFISFSALYLKSLPIYYTLMEVAAGHVQPYATLIDDADFMLRCFFAIQMLFWGTLWAIKFSLLFLFRRLTIGLPRYNVVWYLITGFTGISYVLCVITEFTSCKSIHAWLNAGECSSSRDTKAEIISLYFVLAMDLTSDLLIMAIPIRMLWSLRISLIEKISVGVAFGVGVLTMIFAIVRVAALIALTGGDTDVPFLALFASIESFVAMVVGCLPAFAFFIRGNLVSAKPVYNNDGVITIGSSRNKSRVRRESILLDDVATQVPKTADQSESSLDQDRRPSNPEAQNFHFGV